MFFFPQDELARNQAKKMFEIIVKKEGLEFLGWRDLPIQSGADWRQGSEKMPPYCSGFIGKPSGVEKGLEFDRRLYVARPCV